MMKYSFSDTQVYAGLFEGIPSCSTLCFRWFLRWCSFLFYPYELYLLVGILRKMGGDFYMPPSFNLLVLPFWQPLYTLGCSFGAFFLYTLHFYHFTNHVFFFLFSGTIHFYFLIAFQTLLPPAGFFPSGKVEALHLSFQLILTLIDTKQSSLLFKANICIIFS